MRIVQNASGVHERAVLTVKLIVETDNALVERTGADDDLERRARFGHIADAPIATSVGRRATYVGGVKCWSRTHRKDFAGLGA